ncbi:MAG: glycosyltransferase family 2 protein [Kiritimatiellia bacterium]
MPTQVSILFPVYNAVDTVEAAVQSILDQSYPNWELHWIDDGSTDGSTNLGHRLSQQDPRIHFYPRQHQGLVSALQQVILHAGIRMQQVRSDLSDQYFARMDADDFCYTDRFSEQVAFLEAHPACDLVSCQVDFGGDRNRQSGYAAHVDWVNGLLSPGDHFLNRFVDSPVPHPSVMFRAASLAKYGGYQQGDFPEDYELWLRWLDAGAEFHKLPRKLMTWNDPPTRLSRNDSRYAQEAFYELKCRYLVKVLPANRPIWLWGAGRLTRRRFKLLEALGFPFAGFIDVDPGKIDQVIDGRRVQSPETLPSNAFFILGVSNPGARDKIETRLKTDGLQAGRDYLSCA